MENSENQIARRTFILATHLLNSSNTSGVPSLHGSPCLHFSPPETASGKPAFDIGAMRQLMDGHHIEYRDEIFKLIANSDVFHPRKIGGQLYVSPDFNMPMEHQREMAMKRILYLLEKGVFKGWLTDTSVEQEMRKAAALECLEIYDHSMSVKLRRESSYFCLLVVVLHLASNEQKLKNKCYSLLLLLRFEV